MIVSLQRVDFLRPGGAVLRLLDYGQDVDAHIPMPVEQQSGFSSAILAAWGRPTAQGAARADMGFTVHRPHGSHAGVRSWCLRHSALMPIGVTGRVRFSFRNPNADPVDDEVWEFQDCVMAGVNAVPIDDTDLPYASATSYRLAVGKRYPVQGNYGWGNPGGWILKPAGEILVDGGSLEPDVDAYTPPALSPGT
jgi:hypothetical protein